MTEDNKIEVDYTVRDLGGSLFKNELYKYKSNLEENSYPNFERDISIRKTNNGEIITYEPRAFLHIQYCLDGNFENTSISNYNSQVIPLDVEYTSLGGKILSNDIGTFAGKKLYIRLKLVLLTGFGKSDENYPGIGDYRGYNIASSDGEDSVIFSSAPTVSHRSHHIGINTNSFDDDNQDEVLVISDFTDRRFIVLTGTDTSSGEAKKYQIRIDLKQGKIDGAYISGGSWNSEI